MDSKMIKKIKKIRTIESLMLPLCVIYHSPSMCLPHALVVGYGPLSDIHHVAFLFPIWLLPRCLLMSLSYLGDKSQARHTARHQWMV